MMKLYTINQNGQMEMNFDALELLTDFNFVETLQADIKAGYKIVHVKKNDWSLNLVLHRYGVTYLYSYSYGNKSYELIVVTPEMQFALQEIWEKEGMKK